MWANPLKLADWFTFTTEILKAKLYFSAVLTTLMNISSSSKSSKTVQKTRIKNQVNFSKQMFCEMPLNDKL